MNFSENKAMWGGRFLLCHTFVLKIEWDDDERDGRNKNKRKKKKKNDPGLLQLKFEWLIHLQLKLKKVVT